MYTLYGKLGVYTGKCWLSADVDKRKFKIKIMHHITIITDADKTALIGLFSRHETNI